VSEPTKAYRCHWKSGEREGAHKVSAQSAEDAIRLCIRDLPAIYDVPADSIEITKVEAL
jgi:hypothetical protein